MVGERHDLVASAVQEWIRAREQRVGALACHDHERSVDLPLVDGIQYANLLTQTARRRLYVLQITRAIWTCWIVEDGDRRGVWSELVQETEALGPDICGQQAHPGCVTSRLIQAGNESGSHRVFPGEHDRDRRSYRFSGRGWNVAPRRNDDCYLAPDQIRRQCWQSIVLALGRLVLDCDVLTLEISGLLEALKKRRHQVGGALDRSAPEEPDHRHRRLLRACRERPSRRAAEQRDEFAAFHSITSSARTRIDVGTSRPSALAVLRLMISSTLMACWIGKSAGFSPLRIRPV